jgi:hypothetical protein
VAPLRDAAGVVVNGPLSPELLAALIELASVEEAKVAHMAAYPAWWAIEGVPDDQSAATEGWRAICRRGDANRLTLEGIARSIKAASQMQCLLHQDCIEFRDLGAACRAVTS